MGAVSRENEGCPLRYYEQAYPAALLGLQRADIGLLVPFSAHFSVYLEAPHER